MRDAMIVGGALALASCAAAPPLADGPDEGRDRVDSLPGQCNAAAAQALIGQAASPELGRRLLAATGARQLRWAPPRSVLTMDYRTDRLTVEYDETMLITRVSCG
jgi:hypothetical protein